MNINPIQLNYFSINKATMYLNPNMVMYIATANMLTSSEFDQVMDQLDKIPEVQYIKSKIWCYQDITKLNDCNVLAIQMQRDNTPFIFSTHMLPILTQISWMSSAVIDAIYIEKIVAPAFLSMLCAATPPPAQPLGRTISTSPIDISQPAIDSVLQKAKCECGAHATFGNNCHPSNHSRWCPLYKE